MQTTYADQCEIAAWVTATLGPEWQQNTEERALRFIEEAIELVQALGLDPERVKKMVDVKYGEDEGEVAQEIGGTMFTLLALADNQGEVVSNCVNAEICKIQDPEFTAKVRRKLRNVKRQQDLNGAGLNIDTVPE